VALRYVPHSELARLQALDPDPVDGAAAFAFVVDNHYPIGGQGDAVLGGGVAAIELAVEGVPRCGTNDEALRAHRLDAESIAERVGAAVGVPA
jgi:hypothetical protein